MNIHPNHRGAALRLSPEAERDLEHMWCHTCIPGARRSAPGCRRNTANTSAPRRTPIAGATNAMLSRASNRTPS